MYVCVRKKIAWQIFPLQMYFPLLLKGIIPDGNDWPGNLMFCLVPIVMHLQDIPLLVHLRQRQVDGNMRQP